jgi:hypothetical protein
LTTYDNNVIIILKIRERKLIKMKLVKNIDAMIKGKTIETITKKWNKILAKTNDEDFMNWINEDDTLTKMIYSEDGFALDVDWQFESVCYVSLNIYR